MITNKTAEPKEMRESYLDRIRAARSKPCRMTPEEFYQQMERSMGTKTPWITSGGSSAASSGKRQGRAISEKHMRS